MDDPAADKTQLEAQVAALEAQLAAAQADAADMRQRTEDFVDQTAFWFWETDAEHIFTYMSDNLEKLSDISRESVLGTSRLDLARQNDGEHWQNHIDVLLFHRPFKDFRYVRSAQSGEDRHVVVTGWPVFDDKGVFQGYRGTARDETDDVRARTRAEDQQQEYIERIRNQRAELQAVLDNMSQSILWLDSEWQIRLHNQRFLQMHNISEEQLRECETFDGFIRFIGNRGDLGPGDVEEMVSQARTRVQSNADADTAYRREFVGRSKHHLVRVNKTDDGGLIFSEFDVTEHAKLEVNLQTVIDNIDYGVLFMDKSLNIDLANARYCEMWDVEPDFFNRPRTMRDLIGRWREKYSAGSDFDDDEVWDIYVKQREDQIRKGNVAPCEVRQADGRTTLFSITNLPNDRRMLTYLDITKLKENEEALQRAQHDLEAANAELESRVEQRTRELQSTQASLIEAERHATLGKLTASLSHELRNPLNALNTSLYVIRKRTEDAAAIEKPMQRSEKTIKRCVRILDDLHRFSMASSLSPVKVNYSQWFDEHTSRLRLPDGVTLKTLNEVNGLSYRLDDKILTHAVFKVIANAMMAVDPKDWDGDEHVVSLTTRVTNERVEIIVSDTGPGMDDETKARAFEPFFSTRGFGVGLGLPIARQAFERHGGGAELSSEPDGGTTVTLWLPLGELLEQAA